MHVSITDLRLTNFRSHATFRVRPAIEGAVFVGPNGVGKTNVLEAISLFSPGRGMRRSSISDMTAMGSDGFVVAVTLLRDGEETRLGVGVRIDPDAGQRRVFRVDGRDADTSERFLEHARLLWATPDAERMFVGSKVARRQFLDRFVMILDPAHARRSVDMERTLRSRSVLLETRASYGLLDALDRELARLFAEVHVARVDALAAMSKAIADRRDDAFPKVDLRLETGWAGDVDDDVETFALRTLRERRPAHLASLRTTEGPHRADLTAIHGEKGIEAAACSTGEQKAMVVAMILAQAAASWTKTGVSPILLLDEICSHLDGRRRSALFETVSELGCQTFCTGTDRDAFSSPQAPAILEMNEAVAA